MGHPPSSRLLRWHTWAPIHQQGFHPQLNGVLLFRQGWLPWLTSCSAWSRGNEGFQDHWNFPRWSWDNHFTIANRSVVSIFFRLFSGPAPSICFFSPRYVQDEPRFPATPSEINCQNPEPLLTFTHVFLFSSPVEPHSTLSSIWFFPPGLEDICSPPSQVITHPKAWCFLHSINNPPVLPTFCLCVKLVHPLLLPSSLPASLICQSPSIFPLHPAVDVSPFYCCSLCYDVNWSVPSSFMSLHHVYKKKSRVERMFSSFSCAKDTVNEWRSKDSGSGWEDLKWCFPSWKLGREDQDWTTTHPLPFLLGISSSNAGMKWLWRAPEMWDAIQTRAFEFWHLGECFIIFCLAIITWGISSRCCFFFNKFWICSAFLLCSFQFS